MLTAFTTVEYLRQEDAVYSDTGFEIADILASISKLDLSEDERIKAISAEEYQKHAESLLKQTTALMNKITHIEKDLETVVKAEQQAG